MTGKKKKVNVYLVTVKSLAVLVFIGFVLLFINPGGIFTQALSFLPALQFWPAVMAHSALIAVSLLVTTFLFGRIYCSILCPLGILQDFIYRIRVSILGRKVSKRAFLGYETPHNVLRYCVLAVFLVTFFAGAGTIACLIEPYSLFGKMMSTPVEKSLPVVAVAFAFLAVIVFCTFKWGRIWCNTVCPVGSALSIVSRHSIFGPVIDTEKCVSCTICGKKCRARCIDVKNHSIDASRCLMCMECIDYCHAGAISLGLRKNDIGKSSSHSQSTKSDDAVPDPSRRRFLATSALVLGSVALEAGNRKLGGRRKGDESLSSEVVVPPGAKSVAHLERHCVGCQLCIDACRGKVLVPSMDLSHFMMPKMDFGKGSCLSDCNLCATICPAKAISPYDLGEKPSISIGYAIYKGETCLVQTRGSKCGICAKKCPYGAITMLPSDPADAASPRVPFVNLAKCTGCGKCQSVCPAKPSKAIVVEGRSVHAKL